MKYKLGQICLTNAESYSKSDNWNYVNYLDTGNITENKIDEIQFIELNNEKLPSRAKRKVIVGDIIYSTVRPNQLHYGYISYIPDNFLVSTGFTTIRVDQAIANSKYIYFLLTQDEVTQHLSALAEQSTSAYPSIKPSDIENLEIDLPPLETQKQIASILSALDDKIELNNKINENLEQQAQALFKAWFVDFEPFGGVMPENWEKKSLGEISEMSAGGDKPKNATEIPTTENTVPIYSNGISNEGLYGFTDKAKIVEESVTVSARGTIGYVCLRQTPYVPIVRLITIIPRTSIVSAKYIYLHLKTMNISGTGTTQQQLTVPNFKSTELSIPNITVINKFTSIVNPMFEKIKDNKIENQRLASLRDTLLPKLMNGEIDVSEVQI